VPSSTSAADTPSFASAANAPYALLLSAATSSAAPRPPARPSLPPLPTPRPLLRRCWHKQ
jgi:hypothetical protein